jgi:hypothetical protein
MTKVFTYSFSDLIGSYLRTFFGIALTAGPLLLLNPSSVIVYLLGFLFILFLCYGIRTLVRQMTRMEVSRVGIKMMGPINRTIKWEELGSFKLKYYSTRRDREAGWMHLKLKGKGLGLGIDSSISGFEDLVKTTYSAATMNGIAIDAGTVRNLQALKISAIPDSSALAGGSFG